MELEKLQNSLLTYNIMNFVKNNPDHKAKDFDSKFAIRSMTHKYLSYLVDHRLLDKEYFRGRNGDEKNLRRFVKYSLTDKGMSFFNHSLKPSYDEYILYFTEQ